MKLEIPHDKQDQIRRYAEAEELSVDELLDRVLVYGLYRLGQREIERQIGFRQDEIGRLQRQIDSLKNSPPGMIPPQRHEETE